jgi:tRNA/tmRNA/rRNA uracil-C5-methylase (TrmA/RlmC/RlmD family)
MSFDKDYPNRKDHRKPFETVAERVSTQCRHGGSCGYCKSNRLIKTTKAELKAKNDIKFVNEDSEETV